MPPDQAAVAAHLASHRFRRGEAMGRWRLLGHFHPEVLIAVSAAARIGSPDWLLLRMQVEAFPAIGPTGQLYHGGEDRALVAHERPRGADGNVHPCFSDFGPCLYHPIDRLSFAGGHWAGQYADERWHPHFHLTRYIEVLHEILHSAEYAGAGLLPGAVALPSRLVAKAAA